MKINFNNSVKSPSANDAAAKEAVKYLKDTDWYVIRKLETGATIPADVLQKREDSRKIVK